MKDKHGFKLIEQSSNADFRVEVLHLEHEPTGAQLCALINEDENRTFSISFRTPPADSKGTPHVLEHSVLCGSRDFPLRDPFAVLLKSSLHTFLNAFTSSLYTSYPVASQNEQDFKNLMRVYLDATLHPLISRETYLRQAWHYEIDAAGELLERKGVVFNEMKGRYAESDSILYRAMLESLLRDTPYRFDSGGDPDEIPLLEHEELKAFHKRYYHPSNAFVYLYGKVNLDIYLQSLDQVFSEFERRAYVFDEMEQAALSLEEVHKFPYTPVGEEAANAGDITVLSWLLPYNRDLERELGLALLSRLLYGSQAARLTRALVESGLGQKPAGFGLFDVEGAGVFSAGLRGVKRDLVDEVEALIFKTLESVRRDPFPAEEVEGVVNSFEFNLREQIANSPSKGMNMMHYILGPWLYRGDPFYELGIFQALKNVRERLDSGENIFERLCEETLINNPHRVKIILEANDYVVKEKTEQELQNCREILESLSKAEIAKIREEQVTLERELQKLEPEELLSKVPLLDIEAIEKVEKLTPRKEEQKDGIRFIYEPLETADIMYVQAAFDLRGMPRELVPYIPLFMRVLTGAGAGEMDYVQLSHRIQAKTGGIGASRINSMTKDSGQLVFFLVLEGSALIREKEAFFELMNDIAHRAWFHNKDRCLQIARIMKSSFEESLVARPISLVLRRSSCTLTESSMLEEQMSGLSQLLFLRGLVREIEDDWEAVQEKLEQIQKRVFNSHGALCNFTFAETAEQQLRAKLEGFMGSFSAEKVPPVDVLFAGSNRSENILAPVLVSYLSVSISLAPFVYEAPGSLSVVLNYLRDTWLWDQVRVQGGAYGGGCSYDETTRILSFYSWDDPNPARTLEVIRKTAGHLNDLKLNEEEIKRNIIGTIGSIDRPLSPYGKGVQARNRYLLGITQEQRQREREEILSTNESDFKMFGELLARAYANRSISIISPNELDGGFEVLKV